MIDLNRQLALMILLVADESQQIDESHRVVLSELGQFLQKAGLKRPRPAVLADEFVLLANLIQVVDQCFILRTKLTVRRHERANLRCILQFVANFLDHLQFAVIGPEEHMIEDLACL